MRRIQLPKVAVYDYKTSEVDEIPHKNAKNAFVAIIWRNKQPAKVFVVRDKKTGKWMLPGGKIDRGETPKQAAMRELKEESGYDAKYMDNFTQVDSKNETVLFKTEFSFPDDKRMRTQIFYTRGQIHGIAWVQETDDYGWAQRATGGFKIVDYGGNMKATQRFRGGTISHLDLVI